MAGSRRDTGGELRTSVGTRGAVAACLLALLVATAPALASPDETREQLEETTSDLDTARGGLDAVAASLTEAQRRIGEIDEKLALRTAELARLEGELREAEEAHAASVEELARITARVREAADELDALVEEEAEHRERLTDRVANAYMRGDTGAGAAVTVLLGVSDLHDVSLGLKAVGNVLDDDRRLVERTRELKYEAVERRAELARLRGAQQDEEEAARRARKQVEQLVTRQHQLIAQVEAERAERVGLLRQLEEDAELQREIVARLEQQVNALQVELARQTRAAARVDWETLPIDGPMPAWAAGLPARGHRWAPAIEGASQQAGIDPRLFAALVWSESSFHPDAVSRVGAIGLAQLMPGTAAMLGVDPWDPLQNLAGGSTYLSRQLVTFGSVELALAAYNAGPGAVREYDGIPPFAETQLYVLTVLDRFEQLLRHG